VVTRWYGGIKLGAGGLVRAYGGAAAECLRLAPQALIAYGELAITYPFEVTGAVHAALGQFGAKSWREFLAEASACACGFPAIASMP
jgi:putative IMPACT (imprinted ancient) family translation regulator